jgi:TRAP-type C4-dicarboxylate transport system substrate-binding protein
MARAALPRRKIPGVEEDYQPNVNASEHAKTRVYLPPLGRTATRPATDRGSLPHRQLTTEDHHKVAKKLEKKLAEIDPNDLEAQQEAHEEVKKEVRRKIYKKQGLTVLDKSQDYGLQPAFFKKAKAKLREHISYSPGGKGAREALRHFKDNPSAVWTEK